MGYNVSICPCPDPYPENFDNKNKNFMRKENVDFEKINNLILANESKINDNLIIPKVFHFLKIKSFYLGFNSIEKIYNQYYKQFQERGFNKKDSVHASLLFIFSDDCNYFVDFFPEECDSEYTHIYKNEKKGIRYKKSNVKEFVEKNNICIIDFKSKKEMTFYEFLDEMCSSEEWKASNYDLENKNCCHFTLKALELLDSSLSTNDKLNDVLFTKIFDDNNKNQEIDKIFYLIFNYF